MERRQSCRPSFGLLVLMIQKLEFDLKACIMIVGCGDIGLRVAALEQASGQIVVALARSESSAYNLSQHGIKSIQGDLDQLKTLYDLPTELTVLYYFAPPPPTGEDDSRLAAFVNALGKQALPRRVVYISTSGVYGDCGGKWVNEDSAVNPRSDRARRRAAAEKQIVEWCVGEGMESVILRVPGIYGPGRLPSERIKRAVPVVRLEDSPWSNRIHADDLAQACFLAGHRRGVAGFYNISDGNPTTMTDYFNRVADFLGLPRPPVISMEEAKNTLGPGILSFLEESKRLDNKRMLEELGVVLRYPDLALGLPHCI